MSPWLPRYVNVLKLPKCIQALTKTCKFELRTPLVTTWLRCVCRRKQKRAHTVFDNNTERLLVPEDNGLLSSLPAREGVKRPLCFPGPYRCTVGFGLIGVDSFEWSSIHSSVEWRAEGSSRFLQHIAGLCLHVLQVLKDHESHSNNAVLAALTKLLSDKRPPSGWCRNRTKRENTSHACTHDTI